MDDSNATRHTGNIPVPDPSLLTTEQLDREIAHARELLEARVAAAEQLVSERVTMLDRLTAERFAANAREVTLALSGAKLALEKDQTSTEKQIDRILEAITSSDRLRAVEIAGIKERQSVSEGRGLGSAAVWAAVGLMAVVLIGLAGVIVSRGGP